MTEREKVIKGLETCEMSGTKDDCVGYGCPYLVYNDEVIDDCQEHLFRDALALLKAQEPVKPLIMEVEHVRKEPVVFLYECPVCMCGLQRHWVACPICGTKVKWE